MPYTYTNEEKIREVVATLEMAGLKLDASDMALLQAIQYGDMSIDDARSEILSLKIKGDISDR